MIRITNIKVKLEDDLDFIENYIKKLLGIQNIKTLQISKKAIDARNKKQIHYVFSVDIEVDGEEELVKKMKNPNILLLENYQYHIPKGKCFSYSPIIIGTGPAGLFCGLILAQAGYAPILLERGKCVEQRKIDVETFWEGGRFQSKSNVQFGEGGAGTFSDGKLTTGIKDQRIYKILQEFVKYGAPEEILYLSKPHIGTDKLQKVVAGIRKEIMRLGGQVYFESQMTDLLIENGQIHGVEITKHNGQKYILESDHVVLATGHSARDTFEMLCKRGIAMRPKPFSIGARIEHAQQMISESQYGEFYKRLPGADYKLAVHLPNGRSAYTFCMCVGGVVISSNSEEQCVVTNGMSYYARNGINANSALLVGISPSDFGEEDPLAGIKLQRQIERNAFLVGGSNYHAPAQLVGDFLEKRPSAGPGTIQPTYLPGVTWGEIDAVLPEFIVNTMRQGILLMDKRLRGFAQSDAVLTAPETRSSSPVRLIRNKDTMQLNIKGLYSAGEGGGHAGGITSAAVDGIHAAEKIIADSMQN